MPVLPLPANIDPYNNSITVLGVLLFLPAPGIHPGVFLRSAPPPLPPLPGQRQYPAQLGLLQSQFRRRSFERPLFLPQTRIQRFTLLPLPFFFALLNPPHINQPPFKIKEPIPDHAFASPFFLPFSSIIARRTNERINEKTYRNIMAILLAKKWKY